MMAKKSVFWAVLIVSTPSFCYCQPAQDEQIRISTYYPSPRGSYEDLRLVPHDDYVPGSACTVEGQMYYDKSDQTLEICSNGKWSPAPGGAAPSGIPQGAIAMFDAKCPAGWTRVAGLDAKYPRGATTFNLGPAPAGTGFNVDPAYNKQITSGTHVSGIGIQGGVAFISHTASNPPCLLGCCAAGMSPLLVPACSNCQTTATTNWFAVVPYVPTVDVLWCEKD